MSNNNSNLFQPTNFICGSADLDLVHKFCTSVNLPGINLNHLFLTNGAGSPLNLTSDNIMFNSVQLSLLIDEDFETYFEFIEKIQNNINSVNGSFAESTFDFFINITNSKGNDIFKVELINARLQSIGDVVLDSTSEETEYVLPVELIFDHIEYTRKNKKLILRK